MPDTPATAVVQRRSGTPKEQYALIEAAVRDKEDAIVATLSPTIPRERFISVALQAVTRSPKLLECSPASIIKSLRDAAELGLEPSGLMGQAYLVPYWNKHARSLEAQLIPGYRGLIDLVRRSGEIVNIEAHVVRERDEFTYERDEHGTHFRHVPFLATTDEQDRGRYVGAYAVARLRAAGEGSSIVQFEFMDTTEIEATRRRSKAADDGPWVTDWSEMAKKTVARRLIKFLPVSLTSLANRALEIEDAAEGSAVVSAAPKMLAHESAPVIEETSDDASIDDDSDDEA